jgi:hypothetical protein
MNAPSIITADIAAEINRHHELAHKFAGEAVDHARKAGALLLEQRARLQHGEWLSWLESNVAFTPRTAQRYMNAAAPRPKCDRLSYSPTKRKLSRKKAAMLIRLDRARHRDDVVAHAMYLAAELPETSELRPADIETLTRLRERINNVLEAQHG